MNNVLDQSFFFRFWKKDVNFFCFAGLVPGFGMDRRGALGIIEIGNGFAGRKIEELEILTLFNHLFQET